MSTCNRLDFQNLGFQPVMPQEFPWSLLHTQDWEPVTITLQALSLVEKVELVQVHFTLSLRDQRSVYACECKMDVKSTWVFTWHQMDHVPWSFGVFSKITSWSRSNSKLRDHGTQNARNCWFVLFCYVWGPAWMTHSQWHMAIGWGPRHMWFHPTLEGLWQDPMILEVSWDGLFGDFILGSWLVCWVGLISLDLSQYDVVWF